MNPRAFMLLAGLVAGVLYGQASTPPQASPSGSSNTRPGSARTRATGQPPTAPGLNGTAPASRSRGNASGGNTAGAGNSSNNSVTGNQPPAPAATGNVEVTGRPAANNTGTADHPLLPIVTSGNGLGIRSGTPIRVTLRIAADSGHARNGDMLDATLAAPVGGLPPGTPVRLTVVQSVPAGRLYSYGELSLQVVSIADRRVLSDTITAQGKEGPKELPDAAPGRGTEAIFTPDQPITLPAS